MGVPFHQLGSTLPLGQNGPQECSQLPLSRLPRPVLWCGDSDVLHRKTDARDRPYPACALHVSRKQGIESRVCGTAGHTRD